MKTYQALYILPSTLKDDRVAELVETIKGEIAKLKGVVVDTGAPEKRMFARRMQKQEAGYYVRMRFQMDPSGVGPFQARLGLMDDIFRVQVVGANEGGLRPAASKAQPGPVKTAVPEGTVNA